MFKVEKLEKTTMLPHNHNHNQYYVNRFQQETNYYDDEALSEEANEKYYDFQHHHERQYEENQNDYLTKSGNAASVC